MSIMLRYIFSLLFMVWIIADCYGQNCAPSSLVNIEADKISQRNLEGLFEEHKPRFTAAEVQELKEDVAACNARIEQQLREIDRELSDLSLDYQTVLSFRDVEGIRQQIVELKESRKESVRELESNLEKVKHTGIFIVLLNNIDPYENPNNLIDQANSALTSRAIEDLNGVYIERISRTVNLTEVEDVLKSMVRGKTTAERSFVSSSNYQRNHFLYVAKIAVQPLREKVNGSSNLAPPNAIVLNLNIDTDYRNTLRAEGVRDEDLDRIAQTTEAFAGSINQENETATRRQIFLLEQGNEKIRQIERDIQDAEEKLKTRSTRIREACQRYGIRFDQNDLDGSANSILQKLKRDAQTLTTEWGKIKSKEIIPEATTIRITGLPAESFAAESLKMCELLKTRYATVQRLEEITEVENFMTTNYQANQNVKVYRELEKVWIYPVGRPDNSFDLTLFGRFRITDRVKEGGANNSMASIPEDLPGMVYIEGGTFKMGDQFGDGDDDEDLHTVTVSDYYLGRHEVTFAEYAEYCAAKDIPLPDDEGWGKGERPVINVSWYDAIEYCNWRSEQEGLTPVYQISGRDVTANWNANGYRLPTEAEWEYAARSRGKRYKYAWGNGSPNGNVADEKAKEKYSDWTIFEGYNDGYINTAPVGKFEQGDLGLADMSGNVCEWCWDWYGSDYYSVSDGATDPRGPVSGSTRVDRGGGWNNTPRNCRAANRNYGNPSFSYDGIGFRLALSSSR